MSLTSKRAMSHASSLFSILIVSSTFERGLRRFGPVRTHGALHEIPINWEAAEHAGERRDITTLKLSTLKNISIVIGGVER